MRFGTIAFVTAKWVIRKVKNLVPVPFWHSAYKVSPSRSRRQKTEAGLASCSF
ncbi:hypothetical protein [Brevibacillus sp. H7]|uniref:hypothetical protein n=1 Tax=Brevibacillus sp. H7 TaxID=3349138 RepID=UPI00381CDDCC